MELVECEHWIKLMQCLTVNSTRAWIQISCDEGHLCLGRRYVEIDMTTLYYISLW